MNWPINITIRRYSKNISTLWHSTAYVNPWHDMTTWYYLNDRNLFHFSPQISSNWGKTIESHRIVPEVSVTSSKSQEVSSWRHWRSFGRSLQGFQANITLHSTLVFFTYKTITKHTFTSYINDSSTYLFPGIMTQVNLP